MKQKERKMKSIQKGISLVLAAAMACWGCQPAYAEEVSVPDAPPIFEAGPTAEEIIGASAAGGVRTTSDLAMIVTVPTDPTAEIAPARVPRLPVTASAGTGQDARVAVDMAAAQRAAQGWPWYGKAAVVVGCVAVAALATWAVIEATNDGSHDHDSSEHLSVGVHGEGNTVNIRYGSNENTGAGSYR